MRLFICSILAMLMPLAVLPAQEVSQPKLMFTIDGKDLIISTSVTANNSPHVAWTHAIDLGKDVFLYYHVIQNRDHLVRGEASRSQKQVELKWKLPGVKPGDKVYHVRQEFMPNTAELKVLLPLLQKLADGPREKGGEK